MCGGVRRAEALTPRIELEVYVPSADTRDPQRLTSDPTERFTLDPDSARTASSELNRIKKKVKQRN